MANAGNKPTNKKIIEKRKLSDILLGNINSEDQEFVFPDIDNYLLTIVNLTYTGNDYKNETEKTLAAQDLLSVIMKKTVNLFQLCEWKPLSGST